MCTDLDLPSDAAPDLDPDAVGAWVEVGPGAGACCFDFEAVGRELELPAVDFCFEFPVEVAAVVLGLARRLSFCLSFC